ncbi:MAG: HAMP domain-containing histidine kinase [Myxococcales bacterium]|nr:HAMP domain-containing histidine kinase [Myxococcales bacterium]
MNPESRLARLMAHFDLLALSISVLGLSAAGAAGALVVRVGGGLQGYNVLIVGLMMLAAASVVGYYVLVTLARQRLHERLTLIRDAAHELGGGDLSVEVPEGADDLGALGASLNTMRGRVARLMTAQRELLSGVSHELRSPLARILVAVELIEMELEGEDDHELTTGIREEVALLERHISRLIEAQRVTRDRVVLTRKPLMLDSLIKRVLDRDRLRLEQLGWRVSTSLQAPEAEVFGDENALDRVLSTLIENAIRHAAAPGAEAAYVGSFEPNAAVPNAAVPNAAELAEPSTAASKDESTAAESDIAEDTSDGKDSAGGPSPADEWQPSLRLESQLVDSGVLIAVMDRGPGLTDEQCARVFEPFFRGDRSRSSATGGTGLGMYLTRNILKAHGGDVLAHPRDGGGLVVELRLPVRGTKQMKETMRVQWSDVRDDGE